MRRIQIGVFISLFVFTTGCAALGLSKTTISFNPETGAVEYSSNRDLKDAKFSIPTAHGTAIAEVGAAGTPEVFMNSMAKLNEAVANMMSELTPLLKVAAEAAKTAGGVAPIPIP